MKAFLVGLLLFAGQVLATMSDEKYSFPSGFKWGLATAAYQVEGAYQTDGRGPSIWDVFSHTPNKTANGDTGDVADDHYHRFEEDIQLMKKVGIQFYRMSISWSRILPTGNLPVNPLGIKHYNRVINSLLKHGIQPFVTLYHWDLPEGLDKQGGWLAPNISDAFNVYAGICFSVFGDRVKYWLTFNEPLSFCPLGYGVGVNAPGRCSDRSRCPDGDSTTEPYICSHNMLLSHAKAVQNYRKNYQHRPSKAFPFSNDFSSDESGQIGITLNGDWAEPYSNSSADIAAAERHLEFQMSWFADPIWFGDYPQTMKDLVGSRLPNFTEEEKRMLKGTHDFFGFNHYTSEYVMNNDNPPPGEWGSDEHITSTRVSAAGIPIGPRADSEWLYVVPWGIRKLLGWLSERYQVADPESSAIFITENGCDVPNESEIPFPQVLNDTFRVNYLEDYIENVRLAITQDKVDVVAYMAWSLMDNFEWADGYTKRFGLHYVDYKHNLTRTPKQSAEWFGHFINRVQQVSQENNEN